MKLGWSVKKWAEYRHACTIEDAVSLGKFIADLTLLGQLVRLNDILTADTHREHPMAKYAVYVVIDRLRSEGLIGRHGQQGYTAAASPIGFADEIRRRWERLPERE